MLELIERLVVGDAIPSERQLSADLKVSRLTVRAALDDLVREGHLVRRRGAGTFVSEPKIAQELTMTSFTDDMRHRGMVPGSRTLELKVQRRRPPRSAPPRLALGARGRGKTPSARGRRDDGDRGAARTRVDGARMSAAAISSSSRSTSCSEERYGIELVSGIQTVEPTVTGRTSRSSSGCRCIRRRSSSSASRGPQSDVVEYVRSVYRGDRYRLVSELARRERRAEEQAARNTTSHTRPCPTAILVLTSGYMPISPVTEWYKPIRAPEPLLRARHRIGARGGLSVLLWRSPCKDASSQPSL